MDIMRRFWRLVAPALSTSVLVSCESLLSVPYPSLLFFFLILILFFCSPSSSLLFSSGCSTSSPFRDPDLAV